MTIAHTLLLRSFVLLLLLGGAAGLVAGVLLIVRPEWLLRASRFSNRWVSTRHLNQSLEQPIRLDPLFYRYRRISATVTLTGAVFIVYFFTARFDKPGVLAALSKNSTIPRALMSGLLDALVLASVVGGVFVMAISFFLLLRPSLLREIERKANQAGSLRHALKPLEIGRSGVDEYVFRRARAAGLLLAVGGLYVLFALLVWLGQGHGRL